jgi:hypothetical protein
MYDTPMYTVSFCCRKMRMMHCHSIQCLLLISLSLYHDFFCFSNGFVKIILQLLALLGISDSPCSNVSITMHEVCLLRYIILTLSWSYICSFLLACC